MGVGVGDGVGDFFGEEVGDEVAITSLEMELLGFEVPTATSGEESVRKIVKKESATIEILGNLALRPSIDFMLLGKPSRTARRIHPINGKRNTKDSHLLRPISVSRRNEEAVNATNVAVNMKAA